MPQQPDIRGEGHQRSKDNEVEQGSGSAHRDVREGMHFADGCGENEQSGAAEHHGGAGGEGSCAGHVERAIEDRSQRPACGAGKHGNAGDERKSVSIAAQQKDGHAGKAHQRREDSGEVKVFLAQDEDFKNQREDGDGGRQYRDDARGHVFLSPEERAVFGNEHDECSDGEVAPLDRRGAGVSAEAHEGIEHDAGGKEARAGSKERGQLFDGDSDGEEGGSPKEVDGEEGGDDAQAERARGGEGSRVGNH